MEQEGPSSGTQSSKSILVVAAAAVVDSARPNTGCSYTRSVQLAKLLEPERYTPDVAPNAGCMQQHHDRHECLWVERAQGRHKAV